MYNRRQVHVLRTRIPSAILLAVLVGVGINPVAVRAQSYAIVNGVFGNGGSTGPGASNQIFGTLGQPLVGKVADATYTLQSGVGHVIYGIRWTDVAVDVQYQSGIPQAYRLDQNYPNPFNPNTTIRFALPTHGLVTLEMFNLLGQNVGTLLNGELQAGEYQVEVNVSELPTGMYLYRLRAGSFTRTRKLMLLK